MLKVVLFERPSLKREALSPLKISCLLVQMALTGREKVSFSLDNTFIYYYCSYKLNTKTENRFFLYGIQFMLCPVRNSVGTKVVTPISFYVNPDPAFSKDFWLLIWIPKLTMTHSVKNTKSKMTNSAVPVHNMTNTM